MVLPSDTSIFLRHVIKDKLRHTFPLSAPSTNKEAVIYFEEVRLHSGDDPWQGPYIMPLATLTTRPCRWAASGGCVMCGYHLGAAAEEITDQDLENQTDTIIQRLPAATYPSLVFTSNGSFLDPAEVSDAIRPRLVSKLRQAGYKFLVTETRPEFITGERLSALAGSFCPEMNNSSQPYPISISMGLESSNDCILRYCLNKGVGKEDYLKAFTLLHNNRFPFDCYVLLGKPFLSPLEDIQDALDTIRFAIDQGAGYVFVMVTNLTSQSLTEYLYSKGRYHLPSLWRAVTLLENLPESYRKSVLIKGISHAPVPPLAYASTCKLCDNTVRSALNFWNMTGDIGHVRDLAPCTCRRNYHNEKGPDGDSLPAKIREAYEQLAQEFAIPNSMIPTIEGCS